MRQQPAPAPAASAHSGAALGAAPGLSVFPAVADAASEASSLDTVDREAQAGLRHAGFRLDVPDSEVPASRHRRQWEQNIVTEAAKRLSVAGQPDDYSAATINAPEQGAAWL